MTEINIGKVLKERRNALGYSQTDLAHKCGVTPACVCQWEGSKRKPDANSLVTLSKVLHVSIDSLLGRPDFSHQKIYKDPIARKIMQGFDDLSDDKKSALFHFVQYLKERRGMNESTCN